MLIGYETIIITGHPEIVTLQDIVRRVVETAFRHHDFGHGIRIIRITIEELVLFTDSRISRRTVSHGQIGIPRNLMLLSRLHITECSDGTQVQPLDRLISQFHLILHVGHVQIYIIVLGLIQNIERRIIHDIRLVRTHRTTGIQGVTERVDIEIARILTAHRICRTVQSTRRTLVTYRTVQAHP